MVLATDLFGLASTFFLANKVFGQFVTSVEIRPYAHSDHDFIVLVLDFDRVQRGPGYWHFKSFGGDWKSFGGDWIL